MQSIVNRHAGVLGAMRLMRLRLLMVCLVLLTAFLVAAPVDARSALTAAQAARPASSASPDKGLSGTALSERALTYEHAGRWREANRLLRGGIDRARRAGDTRMEAKLTAQLGSVLRRQERWDEAREAYERALRLSTAAGDRSVQAASWFGLGEIGYFKATYYFEGDLVAPREAVQRSLQLREAIGDKAGTAESLYRLGTISERLREMETAHALFERGAALAREAGDPRHIANNLTHLASRYAGQQDLDRALAYDLEAVAVSERAGGSRLGLAFFLANVGSDYQSKGDLGQAFSYARRALAVSQSLRHQLTIARNLSLLADLHAASGRLDEAIEFGERALSTACKAGLARPTFEAWLSLGDLDAKRGNLARARESYEAGLALARARRYAEGIAQSSARLEQLRQSKGN